jgi:hypothetical protein
MLRAERSGSRGRRVTVPGRTFEASMPALAQTKPCRVLVMAIEPLRLRKVAPSLAIRASRACQSPAGISATRPSALETILWVTTTTSSS